MILWHAFLHFDLVSQRVTVIHAACAGEQAIKGYSFLDPRHEKDGTTAKRSEIVFGEEQGVIIYFIYLV
jgi:hypothetical protein